MMSAWKPVSASNGQAGMEVLTAENGTRARIAALGIIHLDHSSALMDGREAASEA
jgi:hypothetical protein